jgi:spoIIIJ-associated protein
MKKIEIEVRKIAKEVLETKIDAKLDPMNSFERRLVHTIVSEFDGLYTESEGEPPNRYVVIKYKAS